jgi:hypothetical protein
VLPLTGWSAGGAGRGKCRGSLTFKAGVEQCCAQFAGGKTRRNFVTPNELDAYYSLVAAEMEATEPKGLRSFPRHFFRDVGGGYLGGPKPSAARQIRTKKVKEYGT